jgi:RNA polymerase sigma factor (TIGR02999 family)
LNESLHGKKSATDELVLLLGSELREIAQRHLRYEHRDHTLQPTALVNEVYLRLIGQTRIDWKNTCHFRAMASQLMRRILVDHARAKGAEKRGGARQRVCLDDTPLAISSDPLEILALEELLTTLHSLNPRHAQIVECRVFGGLTIEETAESLGVSTATVKNDWRFARAWLASQLQED